MINMTYQKIVIDSQHEIRTMVRQELRSFVAENNIRPPVDFETLEEQAKRLLKDLNLDDRFLEFAIVVTANEIWSEVVYATPFSRRLLLLPQCLRSINHCKGVFDDLGLVCAGCNNCNINGILEQAESLGYTTLVADGTTVAVKLLEEGAIDAVIGVGCMSALKESFRPVNRMAVPALALPLLIDGCKNTSLDYKWLTDEISKFNPNPDIRPLSVSLLNNRIGDFFSSSSLSHFFSGETETEELAHKVMETGGRRMRPLLLLLAYLSYTGDQDIDEISSTLALIIECFHKASLVHDDIEDGSDTRYGTPTLHRAEGIPVAVNTGDYLIGKGYSLLARLPCKPDVLAESFRLVSESHMKMSEGQGADIKLSDNLPDYSPEDMLNIYKLKTGEAIKVSLLLGAVPGNAPGDDLKHLSRFSGWFGKAYQVRDDLNEYRENNEPCNPLDFPFLLTLLKEEASGRDILLNGLLQNGEHNLLRNKLDEFRIAEKAEAYLQDCIKKCYMELDSLRNFRLRLSLYGVIGKVFNAYNI